jgi:ubiquitin C-terminal hydrolase
MNFRLDHKEYRLISSIEHLGVLNAGHYYCKTLRNEKLLKIDDNKVDEINEMNSTDNTYMIFYEQI